MRKDSFSTIKVWRRFVNCARVTSGMSFNWCSRLAKHRNRAHLPIPDKRSDVKRIESSRNFERKPNYDNLEARARIAG